MIYFIRAKGSGAVKIGFTDGDPRRRLSQLQTGNHEPLELIGTSHGDKADESYIHEVLHKYHLNGEWFEGHADVIDYVKKSCHRPLSLYLGTYGLRVWRVSGVITEGDREGVGYEAICCGFSPLPPDVSLLIRSRPGDGEGYRLWESVRSVVDVTGDGTGWGTSPACVCRAVERYRVPVVIEIGEPGPGIKAVYSLATKGEKKRGFYSEDVFCPVCGDENAFPRAPYSLGDDPYRSDRVVIIPFDGECGHSWDVRYEFHEGVTRLVVVIADARCRVPVYEGRR